MKLIAVCLTLLLSWQTVLAADFDRKTEKGIFNVELSIKGTSLKSGVNSLDLKIRDKSGRDLEGAKVTVTPWMPEKNHGVWEKPQVTEKGGGRYRVDNVAVATAGRWDLKVSVTKGALEDRALFSFDVARNDPATDRSGDTPRGNYKRTVQRYAIPNVTLLNQDGKKVSIRNLVDSGKPVIIDFIYTTCNTICPVLSASFTNLRRELGKDADKVQLISISIDPEHDRPEQMKKYLSRFNAGKGWDFLTGSREDIRRVLKALDAVVDDKMAHEPIYLLHGPNSDEWVRIKGLLGKSDLLTELRRIDNR